MNFNELIPQKNQELINLALRYSIAYQALKAGTYKNSEYWLEKIKQEIKGFKSCN